MAITSADADIGDMMLLTDLVAVAVASSFGMKVTGRAELYKKLGNRTFAAHPLSLAANASDDDAARSALKRAIEWHDVESRIGRTDADRIIATGRVEYLRSLAI